MTTLGAIIALAWGALGWAFFLSERATRIRIVRSIASIFGDGAINYVLYGEKE